MDSVKKIFKFIFFRFGTNDLFELNNKDLKLGLMITWLVGMGRYWDDPGAHIGQHLGIGSVIYVFVLSLIIYLFLLPLKVKNLSYKRILTFVCMTSLPAVLYAIPVERFMDINSASNLNAQFLALVAAWRVSLYFLFLLRIGLPWLGTIIVTILPLNLIVTSLTLLNLERVVFGLMGGFRTESAANGAYEILMGLTLVSLFSVGPFLLAYIAYVIYRRKKFKPQETTI